MSLKYGFKCLNINKSDTLELTHLYYTLLIPFFVLQQIATYEKPCELHPAICRISLRL